MRILHEFRATWSPGRAEGTGDGGDDEMGRKSDLFEIAVDPGSNGAPPRRAEQEASSPSASKLSVRELEERFRTLSQLMYTTSVPLSTLETEVIPYLAPNITFTDPWLRARGFGKYRTGLRGFHCIIHFDFDVFQLNVQLNEQRDGGRAIVDGIMNLRQLGFYSYPLRTILVYDFVMTDGGESFQIVNHEEMWSFADMIQNAPLVGRLYEKFRFVSGYFFTAMFWLGCAVKTRLPSSRQEARAG
jgi:hypothetical protein